MTTEHIIITLFIGVLSLYLIVKLVLTLLTTIIVREHQFALHYHLGKLQGILDTGRHRFLGLHHEVKILEKRATELNITGQELLTKDQASLKVSALVRYRIANPELYLTASAEPEVVLYTAAQIAIRDAISQTTLEDVLTRKLDQPAKLTSLVEITAQQLGLAVDTVLIKDVMPNGEIKGALTDALLAKKRALTTLETARGEAAALRIKSNAARLYEKHPSLLQLELIQALQINGLGTQNTFSFNGLEELTKLLKEPKTT